MKAQCASTALKVYRFVRAAVPQTFPPEALKELDQLPAQSWRAFAERANPRQLVRHPELARLLESIALPRVATAASGPLFDGTIILVQVVFDTATTTGLKIPDTDMIALMLYTRSALVPIQRYASQYGFCSARVQATFVTFPMQIYGTVFPDSDIGDWADQIINCYGFTNACLVFPFDVSDGSRPNPSLLVTPEGGTITGGYHQVSSAGSPYCVCALTGTPVQMLDLNNYFADTLSHELTEMIVNPASDFRNPEVCDACADGNCNNRRRIGFGRENEYLGDATNSLSGVYYYISGIAKYGTIDQASDMNCALPTLDPLGVCVYPPPLSWPGQGTLSYNGTDIHIAGAVRIAGHYSVADQRHLAFLGTQDQRVHEIYWKAGQVGVEGMDQLPLSIAESDLSTRESLRHESTAPCRFRRN